mmetsp:Transcript_2102/g.4309  ORF Transcript_2102/g.4309 Transcript_2102/m.4309 type:complete len:153 (+) Transcript_2102:185-643(+)
MMIFKDRSEDKIRKDEMCCGRDLLNYHLGINPGLNPCPAWMVELACEFMLMIDILQHHKIQGLDVPAKNLLKDITDKHCCAVIGKHIYLSKEPLDNIACISWFRMGIRFRSLYNFVPKAQYAEFMELKAREAKRNGTGSADSPLNIEDEDSS